MFLTWTSLLDLKYPNTIKVADENARAEKGKSRSTKDELQRTNVLIKTLLTESILATVMNGIFVGYLNYMRSGDLQFALLKIQTVSDYF